MSISSEWTEYHLTPSGWVEGSRCVDFGGATTLVPPRDRVLTCRYSEKIRSPYVGGRLEFVPEKRTQEVWRHEADGRVRKLLDKFGPCPEGI